MPGSVYTVETEGLAEVVSAIQRLGLGPSDTLPWRKNLGEEAILNVADRFATGTAPDGSRWPESGRVKAGGGQTLLNLAHLRDSVHYTPTGGDLEISSNNISADVHDKGKTILPKKGEFLVFMGSDGKLVFTRAVHMPKRTFMPEYNDGDADSQSIDSSFEAFIERRWDKGNDNFGGS
jgi:Phage virion morphogenesis family